MHHSLLRFLLFKMNFTTKPLLTLIFLFVTHQSAAFNTDKLITQITNLSQTTGAAHRFDKHLNILLSLDKDYLSFKHTAEFNCNTTQYSTGDNQVTINTLKPADIRVVAALGDSLTAGLGAGASNIEELLLEYRGLAFPIGGDNSINTTLTLPNILREFSGNLSGFSTGTTWLYDHNGDNLNRAISGSHAFDLLEQAKSLTRLILNSKEIDFRNDWKVVTMFIGANDICQSCHGKEENLPENWIGYIRNTLG